MAVTRFARYSISAATLALLAGAIAGYTARAVADSSAQMLLLGGEGTVIARGADAFSFPFRNSSREHRKSFVIGNSLFKENWVASPASVRSRQGLGPMFNAQSCSSCHFKDGRGQPPLKSDEAFSSMLIRLSLPGAGPHSAPLRVPHYGDQLNHRAIVGVKAPGDVRVRFKESKGSYPDGTAYSLLEPEYEFLNLSYGELPEQVQISARVAPAVIGLGLLEAISEKDLLAHADPEDKDGDGVSGRPNRVWDVAARRVVLGRFGLKANQPSIAQQNASAFLGDMGITSPLFPKQNCPDVATDCIKAASLSEPEITARDMEHMNTYIRLLAVPARRSVTDPQAQAGYVTFRAARCQTCHVESYRTAAVRGFPELSEQRIFPFTDLLLHDMGDGLADGRPDFLATGREWRTPPLWGIGLVREVNGHTRFLHDGRARNLEEAILWHGGEAERSKRAFMAMKKSEREALIRFLETL